MVSALQAQARAQLELTPEQRERDEDATAAALRALAVELAHESQATEIQSALAVERDVARTVVVGLVDEMMTRDALLHEVNQALAIYVVYGPEKGGDPLASLAQSAGFTHDDPAWRRAVADRLAAKLGKSPGDVDECWPARASERAS